VAGIDLEQSLNYVDAAGPGLEWCYTSMTYPRVFYRTGSRPFLEELVGPEVSAQPQMSRLQHCLQVLAERVAHFSHLGFSGPTDRAMSEEELIRSGQGWCNEQARVLVALTQVAGLPSRIVFASMRDGRGHVLSEVHVDGRWILVDQTETYVFVRADGRPVNVLDFKTEDACWREVDKRYKAQLMRAREGSRDVNFWDRTASYGTQEHPLELFHSVGYCNYFIH
jgi:hypothetical protein